MVTLHLIWKIEPRRRCSVNDLGAQLQISSQGRGDEMRGWRRWWRERIQMIIKLESTFVRHEENG
jgi:hypothetical protein